MLLTLNLFTRKVNRMTDKEKLLKFLEAWYTWLREGAKEDKPFSREVGLCTNTSYMPDADETSSVVEALKREFIRDGLIEDFPFGEDEYDEAQAHDTMHLDRNRIAWVQAKIEQLRKELEE